MLRRILILFFFLIHGYLNSQSLDQNELSELLSQSQIEQILEGSQVNETVSTSETLSKLQVNSSIFGISYINTTPTSISATTDLPVPNEYKISLRDELKIILSGSKQRIFNAQVQLDGTIFFPEIGAISVVGEDFYDVKQKLQNLVDNNFVGVNLDLSLNNLSAKKINILGAVKTPGVYLVNPFTTISNALAYSGGVENYASLREIKLIRGEKEFVFDLYDLLIEGDRSNDLTLEPGDTLLIGGTTNFISISGGVLRPFTYEYKDDENIGNILYFSLGLKPSANTEKIFIKSRSEKEDKVVISKLDLDENKKIVDYKGAIQIFVFETGTSSTLDILVSGPLENPGYYSYDKYQNLKGLVKDLKFTNSINKYIGVVQNEEYSQLFSLNDIDTLDIKLEANSEVFFFQKNSALTSGLTANSENLIQDYLLTIRYKGNIKNFAVFGRFSIQDVIEEIGIDLTDAIEDKTTYSSPLEDKVVVGDYRDMSFISKKFHEISFRFEDQKTISVSINGEVNLPGSYVLDSSSTIADLYKIVGGFKDTAEDNVIFQRVSVRNANQEKLDKARRELNDFISTSIQQGKEVDQRLISLSSADISDVALGRINGNFSPDSKIIDNFLLDDGDQLFIPRKLNIITVIGEVQSPNTSLYQKGLSIKDYIENSGGYRAFADKRKIYVLRADGSIDRYKGIFRSNLKLMPGDTIVVPKDIQLRGNWTDVIIPISSLISNLAFATASLEVISDN